MSTFDRFNHPSHRDEFPEAHEARRISLDKETRKEYGAIYYRYHNTRLKQMGISGSNFIKDRDVLEEALKDHENRAEIMDILSQNIDMEDNHYLNLKNPEKEGVSVSHESTSTQGGKPSKDQDELEILGALFDEGCGTQAVMSHLSFYLGDSRAWRNGWNPKSYQRHVKKVQKDRSANGVIWGEFSSLDDRLKTMKRVDDKKLAVMAKLERREARRVSKANAVMRRIGA